MKKETTEQLYRIKFRCDKIGSMVQAEQVGSKFKCPACDSVLKYVHQDMQLTSESSIPHEIRKVIEIDKQ